MKPSNSLDRDPTTALQRFQNFNDIASKSISDAMVNGMKNLAKLVDVEYFDILPQVFGDEEAEKSEKGQEIVAEVKQIYEDGEKIFEIFQKMSDDLSKE